MDGKKFMNLMSSLKDPERQETLEFLKNNIDVFAWLATDMPGVDPDVIIHKLKVDPQCKPVCQKKCDIRPTRQKVNAEETNKFLEAVFVSSKKIESV